MEQPINLNEFIVITQQIQVKKLHYKKTGGFYQHYIFSHIRNIGTG